MRNSTPISQAVRSLGTHLELWDCELRIAPRADVPMGSISKKFAFNGGFVAHENPQNSRSIDVIPQMRDALSTGDGRMLS
jgi:hypothetical protein